MRTQLAVAAIGIIATVEAVNLEASLNSEIQESSVTLAQTEVMSEVERKRRGRGRGRGVMQMINNGKYGKAQNILDRLTQHMHSHQHAYMTHHNEHERYHKRNQHRRHHKSHSKSKSKSKSKGKKSKKSKKSHKKSRKHSHSSDSDHHDDHHDEHNHHHEVVIDHLHTDPSHHYPDTHSHVNEQTCEVVPVINPHTGHVTTEIHCDDHVEADHSHIGEPQCELVNNNGIIDVVCTDPVAPDHSHDHEPVCTVTDIVQNGIVVDQIVECTPDHSHDHHADDHDHGVEKTCEVVPVQNPYTGHVEHVVQCHDGDDHHDHDGHADHQHYDHMDHMDHMHDHHDHQEHHPWVPESHDHVNEQTCEVVPVVNPHTGHVTTEIRCDTHVESDHSHTGEPSCELVNNNGIVEVVCTDPVAPDHSHDTEPVCTVTDIVQNGIVVDQVVECSTDHSHAHHADDHNHGMIPDHHFDDHSWHQDIMPADCDCHAKTDAENCHLADVMDPNTGMVTQKLVCDIDSPHGYDNAECGTCDVIEVQDNMTGEVSHKLICDTDAGAHAGHDHSYPDMHDHAYPDMHDHTQDMDPMHDHMHDMHTDMDHMDHMHDHYNDMHDHMYPDIHVPDVPDTPSNFPDVFIDGWMPVQPTHNWQPQPVDFHEQNLMPAFPDVFRDDAGVTDLFSGDCELKTVFDPRTGQNVTKVVCDDVPADHDCIECDLVPNWNAQQAWSGV